MIRKPLLVIADADALIAQILLSDSNHQTACTTSQKLIQLHVKVIYPLTSIFEAVTALQGKLKQPILAQKLAIRFQNPALPIQDIDKKTYEQALKYFDPNKSKKNTIFDCIVAAIAEKENADAIFSFDHFYKSKGYKLAGEL